MKLTRIFCPMDNGAQKLFWLQLVIGLLFPPWGLTFSADDLSNKGNASMGQNSSVVLMGANAEQTNAFQKTILKIEPEIKAWNQASEYEKRGQFTEAIEQYKEAIRLSNYDWPYHLSLLEIYEKTHQNDLAIQELDWLIKRSEKAPNQKLRNELIRKRKELLAKRK